MIRKSFFVWFFFSIASQDLSAASLAQAFEQVGYAELCDTENGAATFEALYALFDEFIAFLQANPAWAQKLYSAKERFIRSKERCYYGTDFFGFYDESAREGRSQIAFYYAPHFHAFLCALYPQIKQIPEITRFLERCFEIQEQCVALFEQAATALDVGTIFSGQAGPPILFKVIKYLPAYHVEKPHYDGTAFSLFLDSTDNQSLLLAPYKASFTTEDFSAPARRFSRERDQNSILLIPGTLLKEFSVYPTPHIVVQSGKTRYATIAFAMRPDCVLQKDDFPSLPNFKH